MKFVKFNKSVCGVDFLLNVLDFKSFDADELSGEVQSTDFFQIVFIKRAKGVIQLNDCEIVLQDNSVMFISQNQKHQWKIEGDNFDAHILVFQEDFLNEFFADKYFTYRLLYFYQSEYPLYFCLKNDELAAYLQNLTEIKRELVNPKNDSSHVIRSFLYFMLIQLNRTYAEINGIESAIAIDNMAYEFRRLVERHIYTKQRIEDYTDLMGISRVSLNKLVKAQFNVTATDFIKSRLIFEIKMKLIYTNMTISEIASELNFSEPNHLSRLFKNKEGMSPVQFREDYQNGRH